MDRHKTLLDQLRIHRPEVPPQQGATVWRRWIIVICAVVAVVAAAAICIFVFTRDSVPVRTVIAKSVATGAGPSTGGSLLDASGYVVALREATVSGKNTYKVDEVLIQEGLSLIHI